MVRPASHLPSERRQIIIAVNPKAGAVSPGGRVARLIDLLEEQGMDVKLLSDLDTVAAESNRLHAEGRLRTLIGVGGDGTAAELINRTVPGVPLTVFPAGNENLLARQYGLGPSPEECAKIVADGAFIECDAGRAGDRIFLCMCSCGFDADVVRTLHTQRTGHVTSASYFNPIVSTIRNYDYPELRLYWNDEDPGRATNAAAGASAGTSTSEKAESAEAVRWLFAFNMPCYGGGLQIAPEANPADGLLDVCTFRHGGIWHGLYYTAAVLTGTHHWLPDFATRRSGSFRVTAEGQVPYQLDGDPGGFLPVDIGVVPRRLTLVVPREEAEN